MQAEAQHQQCRQRLSTSSAGRGSAPAVRAEAQHQQCWQRLSTSSAGRGSAPAVRAEAQHQQCGQRLSTSSAGRGSAPAVQAEACLVTNDIILGSLSGIPNMVTQHNHKTASLSPVHTFAHVELGVWSNLYAGRGSAPAVQPAVQPSA